jgi:hypothetical protein
MKTPIRSKTICTKIENLKTALFSNTSSATMKLPSNIITLFSVKDHSTIWFQIKRPCLDITGIEPIFFARLQFYNRNFNYFIKVEGKATICENEFPETSDNPSAGLNLWIKMNMSKTDYHHYRQKKRNLFNPFRKYFHHYRVS